MSVKTAGRLKGVHPSGQTHPCENICHAASASFLCSLFILSQETRSTFSPPGPLLGPFPSTYTPRTLRPVYRLSYHFPPLACSANTSLRLWNVARSGCRNISHSTSLRVLASICFPGEAVRGISSFVSFFKTCVASRICLRLLVAARGVRRGDVHTASRPSSGAFILVFDRVCEVILKVSKYGLPNFANIQRFVATFRQQPARAGVVLDLRTHVWTRTFLVLALALSSPPLFLKGQKTAKSRFRGPRHPIC